MKLYECLQRLVSDDPRESIKLIDYDSLKEFLLITTLDESIVSDAVDRIQKRVEETDASDFTADRFGYIIRNELDFVGYIPSDHFFKYLSEYIEEKYARLSKRNLIALVGFDENDKTVENYKNSCIECKEYCIERLQNLHKDILEGFVRRVIIDGVAIENLIADELQVLNLIAKKCEVVVDIM